MSIEEELRLAFDQDGERSAMAALKRYPQVILWTFAWTGGHTKYVLYEFPFGSRYRADFVVLLSYSGVWEVVFIECENTDDTVITQKGTPTSRMNQALSQIGDWKDYIENNKVQIQSDLASWCKNRDLLGFHKGQEVMNMSGDYLSNPNTVVRFDYRVVIGRRSTVTKEARRKIEQSVRSTGIEIFTYDRLLDVAKNHDDFNMGRRERVNLTEHND